MTERFEFDGLGEDLEALEQTLGTTRNMAAEFDLELVRMRDSLTLTSGEVASLSGAIGRGLRGAFDGLVFDGQRLSDAMRDVAQSISDAAYNAAIRPVQNQLGGLVASGIEGVVGAAVPFANGAGFTQGRVMPFANGGVVSGATLFPMRGGTGLMGEAGPEAIMPLSRGSDGRLGVRAEGRGSSVTVNMNISTPDVQGFQRSQSQVAAQVNRALSRGQRNS